MIPVFTPQIGQAEIKAVVAALGRGEISGTFGQAIPEFEQRFAEYCGSQHGVAVSSGTSALQLAVAAAGIGPGDEVLLSASTNIATALAVHHNGATPVPVDSESTTWNLDLDLLPSSVTERTKAIIPVHLYGHPVDMDRLLAFARQHRLIVIEDAAEAHGATCRENKAGSIGDMGCFSFYANNVITTGEGGMVTTNSPVLAERMRVLRNLAFTKPRFQHDQVGFNFRLTGYQAAMGTAQLRRIEDIIANKRRVAHTYLEYLDGIPGIQLPYEHTWARSVYWMFAVVVQPAAGTGRNALMARLAADGIDTRTFFCPINQQPCLQLEDDIVKSCPVADSLWNNGLYLPSSIDLEESQIRWICGRFKAALRQEKLAA